MLLAVVLDRHQDQLLAQREQSALATAATRVEQVIQTHLSLTSALAAYAAAQPALDPQAFDRFCASLAQGHPTVIGMVLAQQGTLLRTHSTAAAAKEWPAALESLRTESLAPSAARQGAAFAGPFIGSDSTPFYLVEVPVAPAGHNPGRVAVIMLDGLRFNDLLGLDREPVRLALRAWDAHWGSVVYGSADLFRRDGPRQEIRLPNGVWHLTGPSAGAPDGILEIGWIQGAGLLLALVIGALVYRTHRARLTMRHLALHDGLTGLPNRLLLQDRVQQACAAARRSAKRVVVMYLDLDNFKPVNDALGHEAGDRVLCEVAQRLRNCVRRTDTVARVSGDEFVVMLTGLSRPLEAEAIAEKVLRSFAQPIVVKGEAFVLGCSIGLCLLDGERSVDAILARADQAMYAAKRDGKQTFRWHRPQTAATTRQPTPATTVEG